MSNSTLHIGYSGQDAAEAQSSLQLRVRLEQESIPETAKNAELGDLAPMWNNAIMGKTAHKYIYDICPYATLTDGILTIELQFFVYPSVMSLPYRLSAGFGSLSPGVIDRQPRSFDVLLSGTDSLQLDDVFDGIVTQQMPVFNTNGEEITPSISLSSGLITSSAPCYTALRCDGQTSRYAHTLTMQLVKAAETSEPGVRTGLSITNLTNHVTAEWIDENGTLQKTTLGVEIPPCVSALLEICEDDLPGSEDIIDATVEHLIVYYNTCTGEVIEEWHFDEVIPDPLTGSISESSEMEEYVAANPGDAVQKILDDKNADDEEYYDI